jgi:predicted amidohydrolase YtcJ
MESEVEVFSYLAIKDGIIVEGGEITPDAIEDQAERIIDLKGKTVVPSFYDTHVHLVQTGLNTLGLDLSAVSTVREVLDRIAEKVEKVPVGKLVRGIHYDINRIEERRFPTRRELDEVAPDHPLWINSIEYHMSAVNSLALHLVNLPYHIDGIARDERNLPKGYLSGKASAFFRNRIFERITDREREIGVNRALQLAIEKGVTSLHAMEGGFSFHDRDVRFVLDHMDQFPLDIRLYHQSYDVDKVVQQGLTQVGGDIFIDGSFGSRTAALFEAYSDQPEVFGNLYFKDDELEDFVERALDANLQIALHAIGDRAIDQTLRAFEKYRGHKSADRRHRIEHFELADEQMIERAKALDLIIGVQPVFEYHWGAEGGMYERRLGKRGLVTNNFRAYIDAGLTLIGSSDSDVTEINPLLAIHSAVNHPKKAFALTPYEALCLFTKNAAYASFEEKKKGTLSLGKRADLVVLNRDPMDTAPELLKDLEVDMTFKDGRLLFKRRCETC